MNIKHKSNAQNINRLKKSANQSITCFKLVIGRKEKKIVSSNVRLQGKKKMYMYAFLININEAILSNITSNEQKVRS